MKLSFLCVERVLNISVASYMCAFLCILQVACEQAVEIREYTMLTYLLALNASRGALRRNAVNWPHKRKSIVRKP